MAISVNSGVKALAEIDESTAAILRFEGERVATFVTSFNADDVAAFRIVGTKGHLHVDPAYEYAEGLEYTLSIGGKKRRKRIGKRDQFAPELLHFSECIQKDREPEPSGEEGLQDVRIVAGAVRISRDRQSGGDSTPSGGEAADGPATNLEAGHPQAASGEGAERQQVALRLRQRCQFDATATASSRRPPEPRCEAPPGSGPSSHERGCGLAAVMRGRAGATRRAASSPVPRTPSTYRRRRRRPCHRGRVQSAGVRPRPWSVVMSRLVRSAVVGLRLQPRPQLLQVLVGARVGLRGRDRSGRRAPSRRSRRAQDRARAADAWRGGPSRRRTCMRRAGRCPTASASRTAARSVVRTAGSGES